MTFKNTKVNKNNTDLDSFKYTENQRNRKKCNKIDFQVPNSEENMLNFKTQIYQPWNSSLDRKTDSCGLQARWVSPMIS